jgi:TusE/DsrC/DsvC family sulfur relay protein
MEEPDNEQRWRRWRQPRGHALTDNHWKVVNYLREYYVQFGVAPMIRKLCKQTGFSLKEIYEMFPSGPAKGACKVAGLPKPTGCVWTLGKRAMSTWRLTTGWRRHPGGRMTVTTDHQRPPPTTGRGPGELSGHPRRLPAGSARFWGPRPVQQPSVQREGWTLLDA